MNSLRVLLVAAAAFVLAGCLVSSLNPLFNEKEFVRHDEILGTWSQDGKGEDSWNFETNGITYKLTHTDEKKRKASFTAAVGKLGTNQFLNLFPGDDNHDALNDLLKPQLLPVHVFMKVHKEGKSLKLTALDLEWLQKLLKADPKAIQHVWREDYPVLTASTADLQAFVLKHAADTNAFKAVINLQPLHR